MVCNKLYLLNDYLSLSVWKIRQMVWPSFVWIASGFFCDGSIMNPAKATVLLVFLSNNVKSLHTWTFDGGIANQMIVWGGYYKKGIKIINDVWVDIFHASNLANENELNSTIGYTHWLGKKWNALLCKRSMLTDWKKAKLSNRFKEVFIYTKHCYSIVEHEKVLIENCKMLRF